MVTFFSRVRILRIVAVFFLSSCANHSEPVVDTSGAAQHCDTPDRLDDYATEKQRVLNLFTLLERFTPPEGTSLPGQRLRSPTAMLLGKAMGVANWLSRLYPDQVTVEEKANLLEVMFEKLSSFGWHARRVGVSPSDGATMFVGYQLEALVVDQNRRLWRGTVSDPRQFTEVIPQNVFTPHYEHLRAIDFEVSDSDLSKLIREPSF